MDTPEEVNFELRIVGSGLIDNISNKIHQSGPLKGEKMKWDEYVESIMFPKTVGAIGSGEISRAGKKSKEFDDELLSYGDITIDTEAYPGSVDYPEEKIPFKSRGIDPFTYSSIESYAKALLPRLQEIERVEVAGKIEDRRKFSYEIFRDDKNKRIVLQFNVEYAASPEALVQAAMQAQEDYNYKKALVVRYNELARLRKFETDDKKRAAIDLEIEQIKKKIPKFFENGETVATDQTVKTEAVASNIETDLQRKALEVEEQKPEPDQTNVEPKNPVASSNTAVTIQQPVVNVNVPSSDRQQPAIPQKAAKPMPPVVMPPAETTTTSSSTSSVSKDKTLIESISNMVFDRKILEYEASKKSPAAQSPVVSPAPERQTIQGAGSKEKSSTTNIIGGTDSLKERIISNDTSLVKTSDVINTTIDSGSTSEAKDASSIVKEQASMINTSVSSLLDASNTLKTAAETFSSAAKDGALIIQTASSVSANNSESLIGNTASSEVKQTDQTQGSLVTSEKTEKMSSVLPQMQNKILGMEIPQIPNLDFSSLSTNISDSLKNAVTSITNQNKTLAYPAPTPAPVLQKTDNLGDTNVDNAEENTTNVGNQMNQNMMRGGSSMPSVVSLSQSTIDNLASAIIKNMTLTPFLNSGRI